MRTVLQPFGCFSSQSAPKHSIACVPPYRSGHFQHGSFSCPSPSHDNSYALPVDQITDRCSLLLVEPAVTITDLIHSASLNWMAFKLRKTDRSHSHSGFHPDQSFRGELFQNRIFFVELKRRPIDS